MRSIFIILFSIVACSAFAQKQYATFIADTTQLRMSTGRVQSEFDMAMEMEWKIKGQTLHFGESIKVEVNNEVDTFYYHQSNRHNWDTLICLVQEPQTYYFIYNDCCGAFDVYDSTKRRFTASALFKFEGTLGSSKYVGTLGENGILVKNNRSDTLRPTCRSPMVPNIYFVDFSLVTVCSDTASDCDYYTCITIPGAAKDSGFRRKYSYGSFLSLPLSRDPIEVTFDKMSGVIRLK